MQWSTTKMSKTMHNVTSIEMRKPPRTFRQPYKGLYIISQAASLIFLIPAWTLLYLVRPRPRDSWTLRESINVKLIQKLVLIHSRCGTDSLASDKTVEVPQSKLKETSFHWLEPAYCMIRREADDVNVFPIHVPAYYGPRTRISWKMMDCSGSSSMEVDGVAGIPWATQARRSVTLVCKIRLSRRFTAALMKHPQTCLENFLKLVTPFYILCVGV